MAILFFLFFPFMAIINLLIILASNEWFALQEKKTSEYSRVVNNKKMTKYTYIICVCVHACVHACVRACMHAYVVCEYDKIIVGD